jgi:hypothetical protein
MKFIKFIIKLAIAFLVFGAAASLYLSKNKNEYISLEQNNLDLY